MADSIRIPSSLPNSTARRGGRWHIYLFLGLFANTAVWSTALLYLQTKKPSYTSSWAVNVPGATSNTNVSLPNIGQASYENSSPYGIGTVDPRQNYKFIASSEPVIKAAAAKLKMPIEQFGAPRIKLDDSTTIMEFEFKGASPEEARDKSLALYQALQLRLKELREQEAEKKDVGLEVALNSAKRKLDIAQKRLSAYKASSGLNSSEQLTALSNTIEELRKQRALILSQQQQASARLKQLSTNLDASAQQAADAFALQTDQIFQQNLRDYSEAASSLVVLGSKFLPEHPAVLAAKAKQEAAYAALLERGQALLKRPVSLTYLQQLSLSGGSGSGGRDALFQQLVTFQSDQKGLQAQAQEISDQMNRLEARLRDLTQKAAALEALNRDMQVAEAVFSSNVTKLDIGKSSSSFGSYPLIQMLAEPTLNETPTSPKKSFILMGASLGSLFITMGLITLWMRSRRNHLVDREQKLKNQLI